MRAIRTARSARPRAIAVPRTRSMMWLVAFAALIGMVLLCAQRSAQGAIACPPPPSIAGSPNSLTTSRPSSAPIAAASCAKSVKAAPKAASAAAKPAVLAAAPAPPAPAWKSVLEPLTLGGWQYISDGPADNPSAVYASSHAIMHNGNVITAWIRWEFARPQGEVYPLHYLSAVTREELDCDARSYRRSEVVYYTRNNLQEKGPSFTALNDDTNWKQAIPGSEPDAMLNWGCAPPITPAAAKAGKPADGKGLKDAKDAKVAKTPADSSAPSSAPAPSGGTLTQTAR